MRDCDHIPVRRCCARRDAVALVFGRVGLVGDEKAGIRVDAKKLARRLSQTIAGHDEHPRLAEASAARRGDILLCAGVYGSDVVRANLAPLARLGAGTTLQKSRRRAAVEPRTLDTSSGPAAQAGALLRC